MYCACFDATYRVPNLQNSDVLKDLRTKLSHLPSSHQRSLEDLLCKYKHLFPDVPAQTEQIVHDIIDVGECYGECYVIML